MRRLGVKQIWRVICVLIYAIGTIFSGYLTAIIKDAMFASMVVLFIVLLAEELYLSCKWPHKTSLGISALLMCLLRNNGIYILLLCGLVTGVRLLFRRDRHTLALLAPMAAAVVLYFGYSSLLLPALGIPKGSRCRGAFGSLSADCPVCAGLSGGRDAGGSGGH